MSRQWNRHVFAPARKRPAWSIAEIRLAGLSGIFVGLVVASMPATQRLDPSGLAATDAVRVVDGDTFDFGEIRVRIADIDTPEVEGRCARESELAAQATLRMRQLLDQGPFELQPISGRDEDRYGRKLRIVTRGGRSLGDQMVSEGLARTWTGRREPWC